MVGPRVFEVEEGNALIPELASVVERIGELRAEAKAVKLRINALELIWGPAVKQSDNPDHGELQQHLAELAKIQEQFELVSQRITQVGGQLKGIDPALVDFYGVHDGHLVMWCWREGEEAVDHWHHVDEGFQSRQPI